ncbi:MAG TPA: hypothetical protein G4O18_05415 [Dehalococcoidia bacterium]|nr:hypothetical protein [Dehalococcoidia bacterium]
MKKFFGIVLAVVLVLALSAPAMAVTTGVTVTQGGGNLPVVLCKWETPDDYPGASSPGTQVDPPCTYMGEKEITIWAVVRDIEDNGNVAQVVADVYHPAGPPLYGSPKYHNLELVKVDRLTVGIPAFQAAAAASTVIYQSKSPTTYTYEEVLEYLVENQAQVWKVTFIIHYCQPAGDYKVEVFAVDTHSNISDPMVNTFLYVPTACVELDFESVTYPDALMSSHVWTLGDTDMTTPAAPTVRNVGNTNVYLEIKQDDMKFGQYDDGEYKVEFDARLGPDTGSNTRIYDPYCLTRLPNKLLLCHTMKMDFSIHIKFATAGKYDGVMQITSVVAPWDGD